MKTNDLLLYGGIAVGAYLLLSSNSSVSTLTIAPGAVATPASPLSSLLSLPQTLISNLTGGGTATGTATIPAPPATFDMNYYLTYQYPVMLAQNSNIANPAYILTDAQATQYIANYYDLQTPGLASWSSGLNIAGKGVPHKQGSDGILDKARAHWQQFAVAQKRSFLPFLPFNNTPPAGPPLPAVPVAKSNGGFLGTLASIVSSAVPVITALAGTGDNQLLTADEVEVLLSGGNVVMNTLPFYFQSPSNGAAATEMYNNFETLIAQYV